jgi:hypothetical protein
MASGKAALHNVGPCRPINGHHLTHKLAQFHHWHLDAGACNSGKNNKFFIMIKKLNKLEYF